MPNTPNFQLPYPALTDPADVPSDMGKLATALDPLVGVGPLSATPPASPVDGQLWSMLADATNGVIWTFRYRAASASPYKWEFVGGSSLFAVVTTQEVHPGPAATWQDLATVGPQLTVPRSGDYVVEVYGAILSGSPNDNTLIGASDNGAVAPVEYATVDGSRASANSSGTWRSRRTLTAGWIPRVRYLSYTGSSFSQRKLFLTPARVS